MKGAPEVVLRHCTSIAGRGEIMTPSLHEHYMSVTRDFGHQGLRGHTHTHTHTQHFDIIYHGYIPALYMWCVYVVCGGGGGGGGV